MKCVSMKKELSEESILVSNTTPRLLTKIQFHSLNNDQFVIAPSPPVSEQFFEFEASHMQSKEPVEDI